VTETEVVSQGLSKLSGAVVAKDSDPGILLKSLTCCPARFAFHSAPSRRFSLCSPKPLSQ
jgi:hypothetical protein